MIKDDTTVLIEVEVPVNYIFTPGMRHTHDDPGYMDSFEWEVDESKLKKAVEDAMAEQEAALFEQLYDAVCNWHEWQQERMHDKFQEP